MPDLIEIYQELLLTEWKKYLTNLEKESYEQNDSTRERLEKILTKNTESEKVVKKAS